MDQRYDNIIITTGRFEVGQELIGIRFWMGLTDGIGLVKLIFWFICDIEYVFGLFVVCFLSFDLCMHVDTLQASFKIF